MATRFSETWVNQLLESLSVPTDEVLQNSPSLSQFSDPRELVKQMKELLVPRLVTFRDDLAAFEREEANLIEALYKQKRNVEWMKILVTQLAHFAASQQEPADLTEEVSELETTEPPVGYGFGKDKSMKIFMESVILPAIERDANDIREILSELVPTLGEPWGNGFGKDRLVKNLAKIFELVSAVERDQCKITETCEKLVTWIECMDNSANRVFQITRDIYGSEGKVLVG